MFKNKNNTTKDESFSKQKILDPEEEYCRVPQIYVMPPKFLSATAKKIRINKKKKQEKIQKKLEEKKTVSKKNLVKKTAQKRLIHPMIVVLIVVIIVGLGTVIAYLLISQQKQITLPTINTNVSKFVPGTPSQPKQILEPDEPKPDEPKPDEPKPIQQEIKTFTSYAFTTDSDEDFLTDTEEKLYGTGLNSKDVDSDGYLDGLELINLYNPKAKTPSRLEDSDMINIFDNQQQGYSIFYPVGWRIRYLDNERRQIFFESNTVEFVSVLVTENPSRESISSWVQKQFIGIDTSKLDRIGVGDQLGIKSPNGLTVNFSNEDKIYSITYQIGTLQQLNFKATFQMMYNSLKLFSRGDSNGEITEQWRTYINNQIGFKVQHPINLSASTTENNLFSIDDFSLQFIDNLEKTDLNVWFDSVYNKEENDGCLITNAELRIGKLQTFLIDLKKDVESDEKCNDRGYYALFGDKSRIIKLTIGENPVREMAQILATIELFSPESETNQ